MAAVCKLQNVANVILAVSLYCSYLFVLYVWEVIMSDLQKSKSWNKGRVCSGAEDRRNVQAYHIVAYLCAENALGVAELKV